MIKWRFVQLWQKPRRHYSKQFIKKRKFLWVEDDLHLYLCNSLAFGRLCVQNPFSDRLLKLQKLVWLHEGTQKKMRKKCELPLQPHSCYRKKKRVGGKKDGVWLWIWGGGGGSAGGPETPPCRNNLQHTLSTLLFLRCEKKKNAVRTLLQNQPGTPALKMVKKICFIWCIRFTHNVLFFGFI